MTFEYPWLLPFCVLVILAIGQRWNKANNRLSMLIKGAAVIALLLAFAGPGIVVTRHLPIGVVILIDKSATMTAARSTYAAGLVANIESHKEIQWSRTIPFAEKKWESAPGSSMRAGMDNIEDALHVAAALVPAGYSPRVVLISDGNAARGDLSRAIFELRYMRVPVDTVSLTTESIPELGLESVDLSDRIYVGERFTVDVAVISPMETAAQVNIATGGAEKPAQAVRLRRGWNLIRARQRTLSTGAVLLSGSVSAAELGHVSFERLLQVEPANVVYVSRDSSKRDRGLLHALRTNGAEVAVNPSLSRGSLVGIQLVILSGEDLQALTLKQKEELVRYVRDGGGLLLLGGAGQAYKENRRLDVLDRVLPATPAPPENAGDKCVVLIIDQSSSMQGAKITMARQSISAIADTLTSKDSVGVLAFNHTYRWVVPIQRFQDRVGFSQRVSGLTASGGTEIPLALSAAYHAALMSKAKYRHLVLVTDGISEEGDSVHLAQEASHYGISISTVGLGSEVNRSFLEAIAGTSGGQSYFLHSAADLKRITLKDVRDYTGSGSVDRPFKPVIRQKRGILDGVDFSRAPALSRYTRYVLKPDAENILGIGEAGRDPLYARWQYGLGRVGLLTSDRIGEWADTWKGAEGFNRLWANITRDLFAHTDPSEVIAVASPGNEDLLIRYSLRAGVETNSTLPHVLVLGPDGFKQSVPLTEKTPFSYLAQVSVGDRSGVFRIRPVPASVQFPPTSLLVRPEAPDELAAGRGALQAIARFTGGSYYRGPAALAGWQPRPAQTRIALWPILVSLAVFLNIVELALRRRQHAYQA